MSKSQSRRDFLKVSGLAASVAVSGAFSSLASARPQKKNDAAASAGDLAVWTTTGDQRLARGPALQWRPASGGPAADAVLLDPSEQFQEILGFGAAFTDAACYTFNRLTPAAREKLFHTLFHPSETGLSVCRTCIGSSDYSTKLYSFDEGDPDPDLTRFSIDHDREYILPTLREARKANPDLFLFSSPWSPPGWMKANGSMLGGSMRRKYMASYAAYFQKFLQGYSAAGVPVQAVTVQNEVDTDQDGRMPACLWPQEYEADFVSQYLGPALENSGTKIWIIDHNYNLWGRAIGELETPDVHKYTNAIAWHGYVGQPEWMLRVHDAIPGVEMYWTEGGPDYKSPDYATDWTNWSKTFIEILRCWCRSITGWNLALDEQGRPNIGPFSCGGLVTINSESKAVSYSGQYWAFAHFSRFIQRGARRFDSQSSAKDLAHAAFRNPDGKKTVVLANSGQGRTCDLWMGGMAASVALEKDSVTTMVWD